MMLAKGRSGIQSLICQPFVRLPGLDIFEAMQLSWIKHYSPFWKYDISVSCKRNTKEQFYLWVKSLILDVKDNTKVPKHLSVYQEFLTEDNSNILASVVNNPKAILDINPEKAQTVVVVYLHICSIKDKIHLYLSKAMEASLFFFI